MNQQRVWQIIVLCALSILFPLAKSSRTVDAGSEDRSGATGVIRDNSVRIELLKHYPLPVAPWYSQKEIKNLSGIRWKFMLISINTETKMMVSGDETVEFNCSTQVHHCDATFVLGDDNRLRYFSQSDIAPVANIVVAY